MTDINTGDDNDIDKNEKYSKILKNERYHQINGIGFMNYTWEGSKIGYEMRWELL